MKELVIDRKKWVRGGSGGKYGDSELLNDLGRMCCLGFYCKSFYEFSDDAMLNVGMPVDLNSDLDGDWWYQAQAINDNVTLPEKYVGDEFYGNWSHAESEEEIESRLITHFRKRNIALKFIN